MADDLVEDLNRPWRLPQAWGLGLLLLVLATWPLWFPGPSQPMPMIPLLPMIPWDSVPVLWLGYSASALLLVSLSLLVVLPMRCRPLWWLIAGCLIFSFVLDQHRLQPWAYQSSIYAMVFASMNRVSARRWLIPLAASIYLFSAAGKFDYQFAHTVGQDFLKAATDPIGGVPGHPDPNTLTLLALCFPSIEFLAGLGILVPRTRRIAAWLLIVMHLGLIAILGPWNRDHSHGVLLWNLLLIAQACLLLLPEPPSENRVERATMGQPGPSWGRRTVGVAVRWIIVLAIAAPLLERRGYWDHWTSWSLYSPHTSHVDVEFHQSAIDRLSPALQPYLLEDADRDGWQVLDLGSWSLAARQVPVYPQSRYQLALAAELAARYQLGDEIRARLSGVSNRWTGKRDQLMLGNRIAIDEAMEAFWLLPHRER